MKNKTKKNNFLFRRRKVLKRSRPVHKRVALHPLSVLFLLCMGVLLVLSTLSTMADSYTVSAVVPLPPGPSSPPTITDPTNGEHFKNRIIKVTGTCPTDPYTSVYVALIENNVWVGFSGCGPGNTYEIPASLYPGANTLQARVFDSYNQPGPLTPMITVYYDAPIVPIPPETPSSLVPPQTINVLQVDNNVPFISPSIIQDVTTDPTLTGTAPPYSRVLLTIHSNPIYCSTTTDSQGFWTCKLNQTLSLGIHNVLVQATTTTGTVIKFQPFQIMVATGKAIAPAAPLGEFSITSNFQYAKHSIGQPVGFTIYINSGVEPYAFNINWGDNTTSTVTRISNEPFTVSHTYNSTNSTLENETIQIEGIDSRGDVASLQLFTAISNPGYNGIVSRISRTTGLWRIFWAIRSWLWLIWPAYLIIILMLISFWLGEREELLILIKRRNQKKKARHA